MGTYRVRWGFLLYGDVRKELLGAYREALCVDCWKLDSHGGADIMIIDNKLERGIFRLYFKAKIHWISHNN